MSAFFSDPEKCLWKASQHTASLNHPDKNHDDCNDQQNVYEAPHRGTGYQTENPQDQQDDGNGH